MLLSTERTGPVATLRLSRGKGNALSASMIGELRSEIARLREDASVGSIVLASGDERFFSAGFDLVEMEGGDPDAASRTLRSFCALYHEIFLFPRPVLAALAGHALAGGCILALAADFRIARQGNWQMGVTEVNLGVPLPPGVYDMVVHAAGAAAARRIALLGETFDPPAAFGLGLIDRLEPTDRFEAAWREFAEGLAAKPAEAFRLQKIAARRLAAEAMVDSNAMQAFTACWFGETARSKRREIVLKLSAKKR